MLIISQNHQKNQQKEGGCERILRSNDDFGSNELQTTSADQ